ncbi:MAG TPA: cytochrome C biogenesis protein [Bacteroidales bacterium]|nr:MAG: hypothetical protein A2X11_16630 [Bacteroidetes bacterium GWE2_42_24]OFY26330.1 MAG: hypothetical protein A2X09_00065 [Bacteroidetes bacterium GWF2_43_11]HAQ65612.1 cytochrome C biogenesis protein [Bacteroidales bacterium]HBZ66918.1 cytochrome C biogenesis protein [Bacteroidales bacterium]
MIEFIISGLLLGFMGSFHCLGMCGPIVIALPLPGNSWTSRVTGSILYNLGRTVTYTLLGVIFGLLGAGLHIAGFQRWVSIATGALMILAIVTPAITGKRFGFGNTGSRITSAIQGTFGKLLGRRSMRSLFLIGLLNGLLPCGLVYVALAAALAGGSLVNSVLFMTAFGLATGPMLLLLSLAGNVITRPVRSFINKAIPFIVVLMGILFILRGLDLGIRFISPNQERLQLNPAKEEKKHNCCTTAIFVEKPDIQG